MRLVTLLAILAALIIPTTALAGADTTPNRYCEWNGYAGLGTSVFNPNGGYTVTCRIQIPGTNGTTVIVYSNH